MSNFESKKDKHHKLKEIWYNNKNYCLSDFFDYIVVKINDEAILW